MFRRLCSKLNLKKSLHTVFQRRKLSVDCNIVRAKVPNIDIPQILLQDFVWKDLDKWHDKIAVVCAESGRSYKYSELYKKSITLANFLQTFPGLRKNDTVAVVLPNVPEFPIVVLGTIQAGLKVTTLNWTNTSDEIFKQLLISEASIVFTLTELHPKILKAISQIKKHIPVVVINHQQQESILEKTVAFREIVEGDHNLPLQHSHSIDDVILLLYSSGTTGLPKGVELTNRNMVSNLHQMTADKYKLHRTADGSYQEIVPAVLPWFHIYGMIAMIFNILSTGGKLIAVPKFGTEIFLKVLKEHQPTFGFLVPPMILFLINSLEVKSEYITRMHTIMSGAAPFGSQDLARLQTKCKGKAHIIQSYGLTEASPLTHIQTPYIHNAIKQGGVGIVVPNTECKVIAPDDESMTSLGPNQSGELFIRGPQVMKGYFKNEEATKATILPGGWLKTGDVGHYDEDGQFFITDRLKELIKVKGYQVAPAELEELLRDHPDIADAAVVGVAHKQFGEAPKAFVVMKKERKLNIDSINEYTALKAAPYKQLVGGIVQVDNIPKAASGKILRRELRKMF